jgi:hypothetical protein
VFGLLVAPGIAVARGRAALRDRGAIVMTDAFTAAGLRISVISEPALAPDTPRELLPGDTALGHGFPGFLFFVLHAS